MDFKQYSSEVANVYKKLMNLLSSQGYSIAQIEESMISGSIEAFKINANGLLDVHETEKQHSGSHLCHPEYIKHCVARSFFYSLMLATLYELDMNEIFQLSLDKCVENELDID